mmetsp:Transcript_68061/g.153990  ORF Transcript_68061/g.153990 Transcript_68061/m.153990 type:complete len:435 (-) Transcript_68061:267-1571(-)
MRLTALARMRLPAREVNGSVRSRRGDATLEDGGDAGCHDEKDRVFDEEEALSLSKQRVPSNCSQVCCRVPLCLLTADDVPQWQRRPFIRGFYRPDLAPFQCVQSLAYTHNESGNIWSHLIGSGVAIYFLCWNSAIDSATPGLLESAPMVRRTFLILAFCCFFMSSIYHCGNCSKSESTCALLLTGDVSFVSLMILASFYGGVFFGFACFPEERQIYSTMIEILSVVAIGISVVPALFESSVGNSDESRLGKKECFDLPLITAENKAGTAVTKLKARVNLSKIVANFVPMRLNREIVHRVRTYTLVSIVALGFAVAIHWCLIAAPEALNALGPKVACVLALYACGFGFYASKVPERWSQTGAFDLWLHSHQLWHICVAAAVFTWYTMFLDASSLLETRGCTAFVVEEELMGRLAGLGGGGSSGFTDLAHRPPLSI